MAQRKPIHTEIETEPEHDSVDDWADANRRDPAADVSRETPTPITPAVKVGARRRNCVTNHRADDAVDVPHISDDNDYHPGDRIFETIQALRRDCQELSLIADYRVVAFWQRKAIKKQGREQFGTAAKPAGLAKYLTQQADFIIIMSADICRGLANYEFEAAVYHQLKHCAEIESTNIDGDTTYRAGIQPHDFEGFTDEVNRYGFWNAELRSASDPYAQQLKLNLAAK